MGKLKTAPKLNKFYTLYIVGNMFGECTLYIVGNMFGEYTLYIVGNMFGRVHPVHSR